MKPKPTQLEPFAVRRAELVDKDKVRYRVYSNPTEFVAVIAENALLAVKLSGISKPHKIVRDLPTETVAIEAQKMAKIGDVSSPKVPFSMTPGSAEALTINDLPEKNEVSKEALFKPISIADMKAPVSVNARILPPQLLMEIIETHVRAHLEQVIPTAIEKPPIATPEGEAETPSAAQASDPLVFESTEVVSDEMTQEERVLALANEVLPPVSMAPEEVGKRELSSSEVDKLLNE